MIDGITILNQYEKIITDEIWTSQSTIIAIITGILVFIAIPIISAILDMPEEALTVLEIIAVIISFIILIRSIETVEVERYNVYEVTIEESVSFNELYDKYEIIGQHGQIYEIKERNTEND